MRYVLPTTPNVCSYTTLAKMNFTIFTCLTTDTGFYFHKAFFRTQAHIFCRNTPKEKVKIHVAVWHHTYF